MGTKVTIYWFRCFPPPLSSSCNLHQSIRKHFKNTKFGPRWSIDPSTYLPTKGVIRHSNEASASVDMGGRWLWASVHVGIVSSTI